MNEARDEHIDPACKAVGWGVIEGSRIRRSTSVMVVSKVFVVAQNPRLPITFGLSQSQTRSCRHKHYTGDSRRPKAYAKNLAHGSRTQRTAKNSTAQT